MPYLGVPAHPMIRPSRAAESEFLNERRDSNEILMYNRQAQMSEVGKYSVTVSGYDVFVDALRYRYRMYSWESDSSFKRIGQTPQTLLLLVDVGK